MLGRAGRRFPVPALALADLVGRASAPFRQHSAASLRQVYPHLSKVGAWRMLTRVLGRDLRDQVVASMRQSKGLWRICRFREALADLRPPLVIVSFHIGPLHAISDLAGRLANDRLVVVARGEETLGARQLYEGVRILRKGGVVALALDAGPASFVEVGIFGRRTSLARGAFALSRLTGVPIVPLLLVWRGYEIHVALGEPIPPPESGATQEEAIDSERRAAERVAAWLEEYLRTSPQDVGLRVLRFPR